jgi:anti-sigma-K factor RskA
VLKETFVLIWNRSSAYQPEHEGVYCWAMHILRHQAIRRLKSRPRLTDSTPEFDLEAPEGPIAALRQMSPEEREILALGFFDGLTQSEIAQRLEEPLATIKAHAVHALTKLRPSVSDDPLEGFAAQYALGGLAAGPEQSLFEAVRRHYGLAQSLREFKQISADLSLALHRQVPPPALKKAILKKVPAITLHHIVNFPTMSSSSWSLPVAAVCVILVLIVEEWRLSSYSSALNEAKKSAQQQSTDNSNLTAKVDDLTLKLSKLQTDRNDLDDQLTSLKQHYAKLWSVAPEKVVMKVLNGQQGAYRKYQVIVVWNPETREGLLVCNDLPTSQVGRDLQLWILPKNQKPVSGGLVNNNPPHPGGVRFTPEDNTEDLNVQLEFNITEETVGGSPQPEGPVFFSTKSAG